MDEPKLFYNLFDKFAYLSAQIINFLTSMYAWLSEHPFWATVSIGVGTIITSELIWCAIKCMRDQVKKRNKPPIEVLIFNERNVICAAKHKKSLECHNSYCSKRHLQRIIEIIDQAHHSIDIAIYTFTSIEMMLAFRRAFERGVILRIISDQEMNVCSSSQVANIHSWGVEYRAPITTTAAMHHKFLLIDAQERVKEIKLQKGSKFKSSGYCSVVLNGSVNWTFQGFFGNWENCVISRITGEINAFHTEFDRMWKTFQITSPTI